MAVQVDGSLEGIDWHHVKTDLAADAFDNGRSPEALHLSFTRSQYVAIARDGDHVVGMARMLSDGVCNAYLLDVWTLSSHRRQGIGSALVRHLLDRVPGSTSGCKPTPRNRSTRHSDSGVSLSSCRPWPVRGSATKQTVEA